jgi:hypothetical protein
VGGQDGSERSLPPVLSITALAADEQREALENFAEALAILSEWDAAERRETRDDADNGDAVSA